MTTLVRVWVSLLALTVVPVGFGAPGLDAETQEPDSDVVRIGPGVTPPSLVSKVEPEYSAAAREERIQGMVVLEVIIDRQGMPRDLALLSPLGFGLDEKALTSVAQWRFKPATKDGKPVRCWAMVEVNFRLQGISFDTAGEVRRTEFNTLVSRMNRERDGKPTNQDVKTMQELAKHKLPAAECAIGMWELNGDALPKDVSDGLARIQRAAKKNYGPALFVLANAQWRGDLLPKDAEKGLSLMREAAVLGSVDAQFTLGKMYERGDGVAVDLDRAKRYYRLCAASGTPQCQFQIGRLLLNSPQSSEADRLQGIAWLELAEGHNLALARGVAEPAAAKLSGEEEAQVARFKGQLERRQ